MNILKGNEKKSKIFLKKRKENCHSYKYSKFKKQKTWPIN